MKLFRFLFILVFIEASSAWGQIITNPPTAGPTTVPVPASQGGFGVSTYSGGGFQQSCGSSSAAAGPSTGAEMYYNIVYQATPFQFANGDMQFIPHVADATAESDVCVYSMNSTAGTLVADTGLVAIGTADVQEVLTLGVGATNLMSNASCTGAATPSACCTGSGTGTCSGSQPAGSTIFNPGFYAVAFSSAATTAKMRLCNGGINFAHAGTISAPSGQCPLTFTSASFSPLTTSASLSEGPW